MKQQEQTIENAGAIIERFGGIRPMASKIAVPVTTVQGWKKRNVIPANRLEQIVKAAKDHNVDISDVLKVSDIANENRQEPALALVDQAPEASKFYESIDVDSPVPAEDVEPRDRMVDLNYATLTQQMLRAERSAIFKSAIISALLVIIATGAALLLLWPQSDLGHNGSRIGELERSIADLKTTVTAQQTQMQVIPQLQTEIRQEVENAVSQAATQAKIVAHDMVSPDAGSFNQRAIRLEGHINAIANAPVLNPPILSDLLNHFQTQQSSSTGRQELAGAWEAFIAAINAAPADGMDAALSGVAQQNSDAQKIMAGVPPESLKGAVSALGISQFDAALGQDNVPLNQDLQALKALAGSSNASLVEAIDAFSPKALAGVLTPATLANHFATVSGAIVAASLNDANVTLADRAKAKLNDVLQIEKGGKLVSGTPTQAIVVKAQQLLGQNDMAGAITALQDLKGASAEAAAPWIEQAKATLAAQRIKDALTQNLGYLATAPRTSAPENTPENAAPITAPPAGNAPAAIAPGGGSP